MQCARCRAENPAGTKFCGQCGAPLASGCPYCGATNPPGNKFCGHCGTPFANAAEPRFVSPESYPPRHLAEKILTSSFVRRDELGRGGASRSIAARGLSRCRRVRHRAPPVPTNRSARACPAYDRVHGRGGTAELLTGARARLGVRSGLRCGRWHSGRCIGRNARISPCSRWARATCFPLVVSESTTVPC